MTPIPNERESLPSEERHELKYFSRKDSNRNNPNHTILQWNNMKINKLSLCSNLAFLILYGLILGTLSVVIAALGYFVFIQTEVLRANTLTSSLSNTSTCRALSIQRLLLVDAIFNTVGVFVSFSAIILHIIRIIRKRTHVQETVDVPSGSVSIILRFILYGLISGILVTVSVLWWRKRSTCKQDFSNFHRPVYKAIEAYLVLSYVAMGTYLILTFVLLCALGATSAFYQQPSINRYNKPAPAIVEMKSKP